MDRRHRELLLVATFLALLAFHSWLLYRMVVAGNAALAALLSIAVFLFLWRLLIHGARYRTGAQEPARLGREEELRRIRTWSPILGALLVLHGWLLWQMLLVQDVSFAVVLAPAIAVFAFRLAWYGRRWRALRIPARGSGTS